MYSQRIDASYRWSMSWFIFSEVMFFGAFFGALFYARSISMPWLGDLDHKLLRSEEHTSELQSLMRISYAVFCLKKKKTTTTTHTIVSHVLDKKPKDAQTRM